MFFPLSTILKQNCKDPLPPPQDKLHSMTQQSILNNKSLFAIENHEMFLPIA
jgi:hypothetical protein